MIGEIVLYAGKKIPTGSFLLCDGQKLKVSEYRALYDVIGTQFGGSFILGTFKVPNMSSPITRVEGKLEPEGDGTHEKVILNTDSNKGLRYMIRYAEDAETGLNSVQEQEVRDIVEEMTQPTTPDPEEDLDQ